MLYPTLNQPLVIVVLIVTGFFSGIILDACRLLSSLNRSQKLSRHFFDFIAVLFSFFLLEMANLKVNYGQFRLYVFAVFLCGLALERILSKFLWTKLISKCYTRIEKLKGNILLRFKHGRRKEK